VAGTYTYTASYTSDNPNISSSTGSYVVTVSSPTSPSPSYSGTIRLTKMGLCLGDRGNSSRNGAIVQVWQCNGDAAQACTGAANQEWDTKDWRIHYDNAAAVNKVLDDTRGLAATAPSSKSGPTLAAPTSTGPHPDLFARAACWMFTAIARPRKAYAVLTGRRPIGPRISIQFRPAGMR
jgi:hypothetical protein